MSPTTAADRMLETSSMTISLDWMLTRDSSLRRSRPRATRSESGSLQTHQRPGVGRRYPGAVRRGRWLVAHLGEHCGRWPQGGIGVSFRRLNGAPDRAKTSW